MTHTLYTQETQPGCYVVSIGGNMMWDDAAPIRTYNLPVAVHDGDNMNEMSGKLLGLYFHMQVVDFYF